MQVFNIVIPVLILTSLLSPASSVDICSAISNPDCTCNQFTASSPTPDITCNFLTNPPSPLFANITFTDPVSLGTLDLSNNSLNDLPEDFFVGSIKVDRLVLKNNNLTTIPEALKNLTRLRSLDVSDNQMSSMPVDILPGIAGLEELDLSGNRLESLSLGEGGSTLQDSDMLSLTLLNLSRNGITSIEGRIFTSMGHLMDLDLSHNGLQEVSSTMFSQLEPSLVTLNLSYNAIQHVQPLALRHLGHLRILSLAHNVPLTDVDALEFPQHLRSLDLSHCALTIINHCRLSSLADLSYIGLSGNELKCTCQLYLLLQWYQNQHHTAAIVDSNSVEGSWTCLNISNTAAHHNATVNVDPHLSKVADLTQCQDTENHCLTLEHAEHHQKGSSKMEVTLEVASSSNTLMATWSFKENGEVVVDGFRLNYIPEDATPMSSPVIPADQRSYVMRPSELEIHFMVCLDVLAYETAVIHQECRSFKDESGNVVIGILAGVVFLVPCVIAMIYVFCKDYHINKGAQYAKVVEEEGGVVVEKSAEEEPAQASKCFFHVNCSATFKSVCHAQAGAADKDCEDPVSSVTVENETHKDSLHEAPQVSVTTQGKTVKTHADINSEAHVATVDDITLGQTPETTDNNVLIEKEPDVKTTTKVEEKQDGRDTIKPEGEADGNETVQAKESDCDGDTTKHIPVSNGKPAKLSEETISTLPPTSQGVENPCFIPGDEEQCQNLSNESTDF